jgi:hypothetical protein
MPLIHVELPANLCRLSGAPHVVALEVAAPITQRALLDTLEAKYPALEGTLRDHTSKQRRAFIRFFACQQDLSHDSPDAPLPEAVTTGKEPFLIIGAIAGG